MTRHLTEEQLRQAYTSPLDLPKYPNNSQSVERAVKLVSEASHLVYGHQNRHQLIISRQAARQERPAYTTKKDFKRTLYGNM